MQIHILIIHYKAFSIFYLFDFPIIYNLRNEPLRIPYNLNLPSLFSSIYQQYLLPSQDNRRNVLIFHVFSLFPLRLNNLLIPLWRLIWFFRILSKIYIKSLHKVYIMYNPKHFEVLNKIMILSLVYQINLQDLILYLPIIL